MDFKVCGTEKGITAIQMDIKIAGLGRDVMEQALDQAREGRIHILGKMLETLPASRADLSKYAPRITTVKVKPDQIRLIIGPGGKTIKGIVDQTGVAIDVEDDGTVNIAARTRTRSRRRSTSSRASPRSPRSAHLQGRRQAHHRLRRVRRDLPEHRRAPARLRDGAHARRAPGDVLKEGDEIEVKVLSVDRDGKIRLTRRELLPLPEGEEGEPPKSASRARAKPVRPSAARAATARVAVVIAAVAAVTAAARVAAECLS